MDGAIQASEIWESRYIASHFYKEEDFPIGLLSVLIPFLKVYLALTAHRSLRPGRFGFLTEPGITQKWRHF